MSLASKLLRPPQGLAGITNDPSAILSPLITNHLRRDVKMNESNGYVPAKSVLGQRERNRQADEVDKLGKAIRSDFWREWDGNKLAFGFHDNRDRALYRSKVEAFARAARQHGWKVKEGKLTLNEARVAAVEAQRGEWLSLMRDFGADV